MYSNTNISGDFYEANLLTRMYLLPIGKDSFPGKQTKVSRTIRPELPDFLSKNFYFYAEAKFSSYTTVAIIKERQLNRNLKYNPIPVVYIIGYRSQNNGNILKKFQSGEKPENFLDIRGNYVLDIEIINQFHTNVGNISYYSKRSEFFSRLAEFRMKDIFNKGDIWDEMNLNPDDFRFSKKCNFNIIVKSKQLENGIRNSIHK
jgi:hypothetical protein